MSGFIQSYNEKTSLPRMVRQGNIESEIWLDKT
jgi:hypothetical protein